MDSKPLSEGVGIRKIQWFEPENARNQAGKGKQSSRQLTNQQLQV